MSALSFQIEDHKVHLLILSGQELSALSFQIEDHKVHLLILSGQELSALSFQIEHHKEALDWYNYSLSLYTQQDIGDLNLAKLHRNRANCYLTLGEVDKVQ